MRLKIIFISISEAVIHLGPQTIWIISYTMRKPNRIIVNSIESMVHYLDIFQIRYAPAGYEELYETAN